MWRYILAAAITAVIMFAIYGGRSSRESISAFEWSGNVAAGQFVNVRNTNGRIRIEPASGDQVEVQARVRQSRGEVRILTNMDDGNLYVCPVVGNSGRCGPNGYQSGSGRSGLRRIFGQRTSMHVDITVLVPDGVFADASTSNGNLDMNGITGEARARTVNGRIELANVYGPVTARSTNGAIRVRLDSLPAGSPVALRSTNGSITASLPHELDADVELATTNGRITSAFPITSNEVSRRRLLGRIGAGGREVTMRTTNGSITLRQLDAGSSNEVSAGNDDDAAGPDLPGLPDLPATPQPPDVRVEVDPAPSP
jgi:DUF4097 and DUF4098 domain-containing protein YvlB